MRSVRPFVHVMAVPFVFIACLSVSVARDGSDAVRMVAKDVWIEARTENFTILSNARGPKVRKLAVDLE